MHQLVIIFLLIRNCWAVIFSLNETEYNKMPALFALDEYSSCLAEAGGAYCVADFSLHVGSAPELMRMIQQYSEHKMKHYNHTQLHRGICVTKTCEQFIHKQKPNGTVDLNRTLEECLNDTVSKNYGLHATLDRIVYCKSSGEKVIIDSYDIAVAIVYVVIITLNIVGSLYDELLYKKRGKTGNPYLLAFSIRRNWERLVAPTCKGSTDPRLERLKLFNGLRTITMICVFFSHTVLIMAFSYVDNPLFIEKSYEDPLKQILYNGSLVTHTFFVMSSFLLAYKLQVYAETHRVSWLHWPKGVLLRWLRLTPTYALVLASLATWMRHLGSGPLWDWVVGTEASACRRYWWAHVLYVNNYVYDDAWCAPQTWYLAADTQLFCVGLLVCVAVRGGGGGGGQTRGARGAALALMFAAAAAIVALHTYLQDLEPVVIQSPETYRDLYATDATFRLLYIRGHTNLSTYTMGLAGGFLTYHWQNTKKDFSQYKRHRWAFWLIFPLGVAVILSGGFFYIDGVRAPTAVRVLYATFYKPVFQTLVVLFIVGCIFKIDSVYRGIVEWRGFTWTGRVSYSAFLLHTAFQRGLVGSQAAPTNITEYYVLMILAATVFTSFTCACALWLCVEAPAAALVSAALGGEGGTRGRGVRSARDGAGDGEGERL